MEQHRKHFCRLVTEVELTDEEVIDYFDIVQSIAHTKMVMGYHEDEKVSIDVSVFTSADGFIYEILLEDQITVDEGETIADIIAEEFDFDFELETSLHVDED